MSRSSRVIVLRGDLYSDTGYGRATRALGAVLAAQGGRIFAVSLHEHRDRKQNAIDIPLVSDAELMGRPEFHDAIVVNVCLPDSFIRVAHAFNVGYFFWETEGLPPSRFWKAHMLKMDRLWAPSRWQSGYLRGCTEHHDIPVVPWPIVCPSTVARPDAPEADRASLSGVRVHRAMTGEALSAHATHPAAAAAFHRAPLFDALAACEGDLFVAVQTDAPRKGLPLLLANWLQFKACAEGREAKLVIKISSLDVTADVARIHFDVSLAVWMARRRCRIEDPNIWFIHDGLPGDAMMALFRAADAVVSATLGEGFGGPLAEALLVGTPVIAPRHTSIEDILSEDYPFVVASTSYHLNLWHNIDVYSPASRWHIVDDASFVDCLKSFARLPRARRRAIAEEARATLLARASMAAVGDIVQRELALCERRAPALPEMA